MVSAATVSAVAVVVYASAFGWRDRGQKGFVISVCPDHLIPSPSVSCTDGKNG